MPENLKDRLLDYLKTLGERPKLTVQSDSKLPLFLKEQYRIYLARLFGQEVLLAFKIGGAQTPGEYGKHLKSLRHHLRQPVVLVLPGLPAYARNRMVQKGISFIVPGNQAFLPGKMIDLREHFPRVVAPRAALSPAAQCTVLYHLLCRPLEGIPLKRIAEEVRYTPMMITKVKDELVSAGICRAATTGRQVALEFRSQGRALWDLAARYLTSPVQKTCWVRWETPGYPALLAGISALSRRTLIADDRLPTYAIQTGVFRDYRKSGTVEECPDAETANAKMELWTYPPTLLSLEATVDRLSLYLSLQSSPDERVQQQLQQLIDETQW